MYQDKWGWFPSPWCNVIIYHHIYIYMIDFFCDFGVFRVKISLSLFYTDFCIRHLRNCTPNFESFGANLKVWEHFLLSCPKITFFDHILYNSIYDTFFKSWYTWYIYYMVCHSSGDGWPEHIQPFSVCHANV